MNKEELIAIGKVVNTHGHRGEVKVVPLTDDPGRMEELKSVYFCDNDIQRILTIDTVKYLNNFVILGFVEIEDMNAAILLKNGLLKISPDQLPELPEGSYFIFDIIGLEVNTDDQRYLGKVTDVIQTGANDVYEVTAEGMKRKYLIPAIKEVVKVIDVNKKVMIISPMEGLLDL